MTRLTQILALLCLLCTSLALPAAAQIDGPSDLKVWVAREALDISQQTNPSPAVVELDLDAWGDYFVVTDDDDLVDELKAKWNAIAVCNDKRGPFQVTHPHYAGQDVKVEAAGAPFPPGAYFIEQSYNIDTAKDACMDILTGLGNPDYSQAAINMMLQDFGDGGFMITVQPTNADRLHLSASCTDLLDVPTTTKSQWYDPEPLTVACCNGGTSAQPPFCGEP